MPACDQVQVIYGHIHLPMAFLEDAYWLLESALAAVGRSCCHGDDRSNVSPPAFISFMTSTSHRGLQTLQTLLISILGGYYECGLGHAFTAWNRFIVELTFHAG